MEASVIDNGIGYNPEFVRRIEAKRATERERKEREARQQAARREQAARKRERSVLDEMAKAAREAMAKANTDTAKSKGYRVSIFVIMRRFCLVFGVTREEMKSSKRSNNITECKQAIAYWARRLNGMSYPQIGYYMGRKDHTSALHNARIYPKKRAKMGRYLKEIA